MTNQEIIEAGQLIHDEEAVGGNTSERVGGAIKAIGQNLEAQDENIDDVNRRLANEADTRANEDTSIRQALQLEITTRIEKDAQEKINRQDADAALQQAIDNEETARQTADTSLQQAISNEVSARQTAVQTERGLREDADATLLGLIRAVTLSLADYYLKTETYSKSEVNALIDAINSFEYVVVPQLPSPSASTMNKIYLVPSPHSEDENVKDEFITTKTGGTYDWEQIGSTAVDLSGYSTTAEMTAAINGALATALAGYYTKQEVAQLLTSKQDVIEDLQQIRTGAAAGATALQEEDLEEHLGEDLNFSNTGECLKSDGTTQSVATFDITDYLLVKEGDEIIVNGYTGNSTNYATVCGYDDSKDFESVVIAGFNSTTKSARAFIPSGVTYIRVSLANSNHGSFSVRKASLIRKTSVDEIIIDKTVSTALDGNNNPISSVGVYRYSSRFQRSFYYDGSDNLSRYDIYTLKPSTIYKISYSCSVFPHTTNEGDTGDWTLGINAILNNVATGLRVVKTYGRRATDVYFLTPESFDYVRIGLRGLSAYSITLEEATIGDQHLRIIHDNTVNHPIYIPVKSGDRVTISIKGTIAEGGESSTGDGIGIGYIKKDGTTASIMSLNDMRSLAFDLDQVVPVSVSGEIAGIYIQPLSAYSATYSIEVHKHVFGEDPYSEHNLLPMCSRLDENTSLYTAPSLSLWGPFQRSELTKGANSITVGINPSTAGSWPGIRTNFVPTGFEKVSIKFRYKSPVDIWLYISGSIRYIFTANNNDWSVAKIDSVDVSNIDRLQISIRNSALSSVTSFEVKDFSIYGCKLGTVEDDIRKMSLINNLSGHYSGKKISIMGDSISTCLNNNAVEFTVLESDIEEERTLSGYPTTYDVDKTIGSKTVTSDMVGVLTEFTPTEGDEGKTIGEPANYNRTLTPSQTWWGILCGNIGATILQNVSWSGASMSSHESTRDGYETSYAWHDAQINKLATRDEEGNTITPDVVIIYRGTNDLSHDDYSKLTDFGAASLSIPDTDVVSGGFGFKEAYALTIKKIREAYPMAEIVCCTLNVFKRVIYDHFPTRNGTNTLPEFNNAIREVANMLGCKLIEFDKDGITFENCYPTYISDSADTPTHPNATGHAKMAEKATIDILK